MSKTTSQDIKATLWKAAGTFRGTIDAANYKDFVLSMLFLKYLDDTYKEFLRDLEERYKGNQVRIERAKKNLPFVLGEKERFDYLYENRFDPKIGEMINTALQASRTATPNCVVYSAASISTANPCWAILNRR